MGIIIICSPLLLSIRLIGIKAYLLITIRTAHLVIEPLSAAFLVENMLAARNYLDFLTTLESIQADRAVSVFTEE